MRQLRVFLLFQGIVFKLILFFALKRVTRLLKKANEIRIQNILVYNITIMPMTRHDF